MIGLQGPSSPFNNVVAWNVVYNNHVSCGVGSDASDGNGIIMDSFLTSNGNTANYANQTLIAFNVVYNNGGVGILSTASALVTVANNSCFQNAIDPNQSATYRPCMGVNGGGTPPVNSNVFLNNIAYALPPVACSGNNSQYSPGNDQATSWSGEGGGGDGAYNSPGRNITYRAPTNGCQPENSINDGNAAWSCTANKCSTDPLWVAVSGTGGTGGSTGDENTQPASTNFALQAGSPAIGYGVTQTWLPAQSVDVGACFHTLTTCP
jgi:hypothetical protein